jgi:hypothetical protein
MWAERDFNNRCKFDLELRDIHETPRHRKALAPGTGNREGPDRIHSAAKGISSKPSAGAAPRALRSMSKSARSAIGICQWPG